MTKSTSMMQLEANRKNAEKSTGPKTPEGKLAVACNAVKHGLFARQLILSDEDPAEYQALVDGLQDALSPVGALEYALVERIAVTLWRQRRLVRAETAAIELKRQDREIAKSVSNALGLGAYSNEAIKEDDLNGVDHENLEWCRSVMAEYEALNAPALTDLDQLKKDAPLTFGQLESDAEEELQSIPDYLADGDGLQEYLAELNRYCCNQIARAEQQPMILAVAELVRSHRAVLSGEALDTLAKYQVMLDNDLYKALKALREAQTSRGRVIYVT
ncbi:MAG: hypothetical protein ACREVK_10700 [Gammaproteobacteria bacterium]